MKKVTLVVLFLIFSLAYFLRVMYLPKNILTFGYDQARDAIVSQQILSGDIKIQGPPSSTPGLYHGVFYYYFLAPAYLFGEGSPISAAYWVSLFNALTVFIVFLLGYLMTKKIWVGLTSSLLFAVSFEATQYATWLSNPTIAVWTVPLMYLGLYMWVNSKNKFAPVITAIGLGLSIQAEIFLAYHIVPLVIWLFVSQRSITRKQVFLFAGTLFLTLFTLILSEFKFGFKGLGGVLSLLSSQEPNLAYAKSLGDYILLYLNQIGRIFAFNSYPANIGYGGAFVLSLAIYSLIKKDKVGLFLSTWLFSHITVVAVGGVSTPFLMVGIGPAVSLLVGYYLYRWWDAKLKVLSVVALAVLIFGNLSMILKENPRGSTLFAIQKDMLLSKQLQLIDYTYENSGGLEFSINSLTSPLWINIVWTYLYKWYGQKEYGYTPVWHGKDQVGQLDSLPKWDGKIKKAYLILEPMGGIPSRYLEETLNEENYFSKLVEEKNWGELRVQSREEYGKR